MMIPKCLYFEGSVRFYIILYDFRFWGIPERSMRIARFLLSDRCMQFNVNKIGSICVGGSRRGYEWKLNFCLYIAYGIYWNHGFYDEYKRRTEVYI